ncbi:Ku protein [Actinoplanes sp. NPDC051859]|uniref:non-homologous end joining protein Ku n=1 Tax=Actinoplanes sp. NPDC051859 TaxID=3363909 RepID=UPI0037AB2334
MARPIWKGSITFGLVAVPVGLFSATHAHEVSFHQYEKGTTDRIRNKRVNERTGDEVDYDDIVKGTDVGGGKLVLLDQEELDSVAPGRSRGLEIHRFVDLAEIDPVHYQKTYYLAPGSDETMKTYALLRDAMQDANRAAIGTLVMRSKEYLAAIRADGDLLVLQTMFFADEVRNPKKELDRIPGKAKAKPAELAMAAQLIDSMSGPWQPAEYRDTYTDRVNKLIKAKKKGKEVAVAPEVAEPTNVTDLLEVLRRSVEAASSGKKAAVPPKKTATSTSPKKKAPGSSSPKKAAGPAKAKKATAKKATAKKATGKKTPAKKAPAKKATGAARKAS